MIAVDQGIMMSWFERLWRRKAQRAGRRAGVGNTKIGGDVWLGKKSAKEPGGGGNGGDDLCNCEADEHKDVIERGDEGEHRNSHANVDTVNS